MMRAEPYEDCDNIDIARKKFVLDLKSILKQNEAIIGKLGTAASVEDPISVKMAEVRRLPLEGRMNVYRKERITNQALWYTKKAKYNKNRASIWFGVTVLLHAAAIAMLLYNIMDPAMELPIESVAVLASGVLSWLQSKKHNELSSAYSLTAHEIILIKAEVATIESEAELSEYVMNCENAFSREHTQWYARKNE